MQVTHPLGTPAPPALADLHRHLDGSLRRATLDELALERGLELPREIGFVTGMGLEAALAQFAITLSVLQDSPAVRRVASEMCEDAAIEGVTSLEIRFAPQLHTGAPIDAVVDAALEGIDGRAGLILCGLYGESPSVLGSLVEIARTRPGVVGIDLAGGPAPSHAVSLADYRDPYRRAAELGIGRTVHASEGRPPHEIRTAIETLGAQRIGHATTLLDDPSVVDLVIARGITIEACPTSNVHTGVVASVAEHPLVRWLDRGVRVCINTDNTLLSAVDAPEEHACVRGIPGMSEEKLARAIAFGHEGRFVRG